MQEPPTAADAQVLIRKIFAVGGTVGISDHAAEEMQKDGLTALACIKAVKGGVVEEPDFINGTWRYRVRTRFLVVVVALSDEQDSVRLVTAWKVKS